MLSPSFDRGSDPPAGQAMLRFSLWLRPWTIMSKPACISLAAAFLPGARSGVQIRRAIGLATLLFVFILPLHFHDPLTARVENECGCLHSKHTDLAPPALSIVVEPAPVATGFVSQPTGSRADDRFSPRKVRAPPIPPAV
jgi:hypothetical protein